MRNHEKCLYKPSIRQAIAICKLIISRFLNRGICDTEDFIAIAVITSPLENQELAKKIAKNLLVFTDQSNISSQNMLNTSDIFDSSKAKDLIDDIGGNYEDLDEIFDDLEFLKKYMNEIEDLDFNLMEESTFNDFYHKFRKELEEDPYKTALDVIDKNAIADFSKFTDLKSLLEYAKNIIRKKINSLEPGEINYAKKLGMLDEIIAKSTVKREKLSSQFAKMGEINQKGLRKSLQANLFDTLEVVDFALKGKTLSASGQKIMSDHVKNKLSGPKKNLDDLFSASKIMGSNLNLGKEKMDSIVKNSMDLSFKDAYQSAKNYDQYFGGNLSDDYLESINKNIDQLSKTNNLEDIRKELTNHPTKVPQWRKLLSKVIDKETQLIKDEYDKNVILSPQMKNFTDKLIASRDNCPDFICKSQLDHKIQDVVNQTTEVAATKDILRSCVKDFNEVGFLPSLDSIRKA